MMVGRERLRMGGTDVLRKFASLATVFVPPPHASTAPARGAPAPVGETGGRQDTTSNPRVTAEKTSQKCAGTVPVAGS